MTGYPGRWKTPTASSEPAKPVYESGKPIEGLGEINDCIPSEGPIHAFCSWARGATTLPSPVFFAGSMLPIIAHEAALRGLRLGKQREVPSMQAVLIAASTAGKSSAMKMASTFYRDALRRTQGSAYRDPWVLAEGSTPGICEHLAGRFNDRTGMTPGILTLEEFSRLLASKDNASEVLNQLFEGTTFERQLRGYQAQAKAGETPPSVIRDPAVSGLFATTFAGLEETTTALHRGGGFYARCLWFVGKPGPMVLDPDPFDEGRTAACTVWDEWSAAVDAWAWGDAPTLLEYDKDCNEFFVELLNEVNALNAKNDEDPRAPYFGRAVGHARRIAMLYAFSRGAHRATADDAQRAMKLVRLSLNGSAQLIDRWSARVNDPGRMLEKYDRIESYIEEAGEAGRGRRELFRGLRLPKAIVDEALAALLTSEHVVEVKGSSTSKGGRGGTRYRAMTHHQALVETGKVIEITAVHAKPNE